MFKPVTARGVLCSSQDTGASSCFPAQSTSSDQRSTTKTWALYNARAARGSSASSWNVRPLHHRIMRPTPHWKLRFLCVLVSLDAHNGDLNRLIAAERDKGTRCSPESVWRFFLQILLGLGHLHHHGVLHRDVKPVERNPLSTSLHKSSDLFSAHSDHFSA